MKITITTLNDLTAPKFIITQAVRRAIAAWLTRREGDRVMIEDTERGIRVVIEETTDVHCS